MSEFLRPRILSRLDGMVARLEELTAQVSNPDVRPQQMAAAQRELGALTYGVERYREFRRVVADLEENRSLTGPDGDPELAELAAQEIPALEERAGALAEELVDRLLAEEDDGNRNAILEIRAGTGGDEAALFTRDLCQLYTRYAEERRWKIETMTLTETELGGFKEVVLLVKGEGVYSRLRFESGGHRVQRVPATESQGRIHTSAATVAVLPEVEEVEVEIDTKDLRIDTFRASGAGGQHVNKTDSAIRITHEPTGTVVSCQDERSQHKNKDKAMRMLRSRIFDEQKRQKDAARASERKAQVGSGDRSQRVRTYNFPQDRLTDHRLGKNFALAQVMEGRLDPVLDALQADDRQRRLEDL